MLCNGNRTRHWRLRNSSLGFSLVELMVVMVILGMLAALVAVQTRGYLIQSKQSVARFEIAEMVKAVDTFYLRNSRYPTTDEGLEVLTEPSSSNPVPILKKVSLDPWKNPYEYVYPGSTQPFEIVSLGADGREGGEGENRDFSSETLDEEDA